MALPNNLLLPYDNTGTGFAPATGKQGAAAQASQGGVVGLGNDYSGTPGNLFAPRVNSSGYQYIVSATANPSGTVYPNATTPAGSPMQAMQGLTQVSVQADSQGQLAVAPLALPTFTVYAAGVATASGKSMLALINKSTTSVLRLLAVYAQNSATNPATLTSYYIFASQVHWITGVSGGTALTAVTHDTADSVASGVAAYTGATVAGETSPALRRWISSNYPLAAGGTSAENTTGDEQGRFPWVSRADPSAKAITIRPGYGVHLKCASTSDNGAQNVTMVFTQASA